MQLTLLSIVVALILENLLSAYLERPQPFATDTLQWLFWLQTGMVLATALSMWSGFALSFNYLHLRQPTALDIIAPFGLLITMNLAVAAMHPALPAGFLLAAGCGSLIAGTILYLDTQNSRRRGKPGPAVALRIQMSIAGLNIAGGGLLALGWLGVTGACVVAGIAFAAQVAGIIGIARAWRDAT
ncbi:MAG: hypothetical protein GWM88_08600 [Pseudomonadales bacterium]|nr:hypothetical protein [Pseudomonadales bacterium]NIX08063.1 hypothetical protein [Pseudomonadales bacterium]